MLFRKTDSDRSDSDPRLDGVDHGDADADKRQPRLTDLFDGAGTEESAIGSLPGLEDDLATYTVRAVFSDDLAPAAGSSDWSSLGWDEKEDFDPKSIGGDGRAGDIVSEPQPIEREEGDPAAMLKLLIVEDNEETRQLLIRILAPHYDVQAVADARSALDQMSRAAYDVLVMDIHLGGKQTGVDVLRIARTLPGYDHVTAVAVTAYALPGDRAQILDAGFDAYISKPFTARALLDGLAEAGAPAGVRK